MYKYLIYLIVALNGYKLNACDVCGSSSITGANLYNFTNQKTIGLSYSYGSSSYVDEKYPTFDYQSLTQEARLNFLWKFGKSLQFEANLPFVMNQRNYFDRDNRLNSFGDFQVGLNHFYQFGVDSTWLLKSTILSEISYADFSDEISSISMQTTSKSIDGVFAFAVSKRWDRLGLILNNRLRTRVISYSDYRFGNILLNEFNVNYSFQIGNYTIIPQGWISREYKMYDYNGRSKAHGTSTNIVLANLGCQISNKKWILGTTFSTPIYTIYTENGVNINNRFNTYLIYKL